MSRFKNIDEKLEKLSAKLGAKLTKDRPGYPETLRTFEERRIDWIDEDIFKAIIIQPTFESKGVNQKIWNLINIAWCDFNDKGHRPQWISNLIDKQNFEIIETNIDSLLRESESNLVSIKQRDLK
ncbi:hypothetical protein R9C00_16555 [Flammeovirgaceae bacterium SG7u.111]|nr:hypothetical protein [Flammeovirgaceae bacterium SG7u.132]WPO33314.1 hypothetical protein R9C00_16555 [Flammeovirgaceae bacterium SG7u.111]